MTSYRNDRYNDYGGYDDEPYADGYDPYAHTVPVGNSSRGGRRGQGQQSARERFAQQERGYDDYGQQQSRPTFAYQQERAQRAREMERSQVNYSRSAYDRGNYAQRNRQIGQATHSSYAPDLPQQHHRAAGGRRVVQLHQSGDMYAREDFEEFADAQQDQLPPIQQARVIDRYNRAGGYTARPTMGQSMAASQPTSGISFVIRAAIIVVLLIVFFARLAITMPQQTQLADVNASIESTQATLDDLNSQNESLQASIDSRQSTLDAYDELVKASS